MTPTPQQEAVLVLRDGRVFRGWAAGHVGRTTGEVVFNTSMTGYQEILTDPSYCRQIMTFTYPQIGNVGANAVDEENSRVWVSGLVVKELSPLASNYRNDTSFDAYLCKHKVVTMVGTDTRALVRHVRTAGAQMAILSSLPQDVSNVEGLKTEVKTLGDMNGQNLAREVTCRSAYTWPSTDAGGLHDLSTGKTRPPAKPRFKVVAYDFGVKHQILRYLSDRGCAVEVVPAHTRAADVLAAKPDGVFLSNGPGDPAVVSDGIAAVRALAGKVPIFGICLGHQILALALGGSTYKLKFGHRGGNHPVRDETTGKVEISAQNHGFAVKPEGLPEDVAITHTNLNDGTVEGLASEKRALFSVQYHPEASPGPHDSLYLFDRFIAAMEQFKKNRS